MYSTTNNINTYSRKTYIDVARGIGIILLILGHIVSGNTHLFNWIYSFHMPLFFFLSGMVANEKKLNNFPAYVKKKAMARIFPYFIIVALGFIICMIIPSYRADVIADGWYSQITHILWYCRPVYLYIGQVWFLIALFWSEIFFYGWYKLVGKRHVILQLATALIFVVLSRHIWKLDPYMPFIQKIPFLIDAACMGTFCYILGFLTERYHLLDRINKWIKLLLIPIAFVINIYVGTWLNGYTNMVDLVFVNAFRYVPAMIAGVAGVVLLSCFLQKFKPLEWIGRYSLPLFASHTFIIYLVREIVYWCTGTYYTMMVDVPNKLAFLMTFVVLILMIPIGLLYAFIEKKLKDLNTKPQ